MKRIWILTLLVTLTLTVACTEDPVSCTTVQNTDGSATILCDDGTKSTVHPNTGCTVTEDATGFTVACTDGTEITIPKGTIDPQEDVLEGSFTVENQADLNLIKDYTEITGDLIFNCEGITEINMENLVAVGGTLEIGGVSSLTSVSLNALVSADTINILHNTALVDVQLDSLEAVNSVYITGNTLLPTCEMEEIFENMDIQGYYHIGENDESATCP